MILRSLKAGYYTLGAAAATAQRVRPFGQSIFDAEWDICVVLDSARFDDLSQMVAERPAWPRVRSYWSRGSVTTEWYANTFTSAVSGDVGGVTLLSANPHSDTVLRDDEILPNQSEIAVPYPDTDTVSKSDFEAVYDMFATHATAHDAVPPETMLDATVQAYRRHGSRVVSHWLQPHEPFLAPTAQLIGGRALEDNVWKAMQHGTVDPSVVRKSYRATLEYALEFVEALFATVDAKVLVTADHGNAFGEWGVYGHPYAWPQPAVRKVPWVTVEAVARRDHDTRPVLDSGLDAAKADREAQLRALGYR